MCTRINCSLPVLVMLLLLWGTSALSHRGFVRSSCGGGLQPLQFHQGSPDNPLWHYFQTTCHGPLVHKWLQYFDVYHRYFARYREKPVKFLEIGIQSGGSMEMWRSYFTHPDARFYGIDINPHLKPLFDDPPYFTLFTGSQTNDTFLREFVASTPKFDIILDDGGHVTDMQIISFEELYNHLEDDGIYMVEDTSLSFLGPDFGGKEKSLYRGTTFVGFAKTLVDRMHQQYWQRNANLTPEQRANIDSYGPPDFTRTTRAVSFYDQMVVFERWPRGDAPARAVKRGDFIAPFASRVFDPKMLQQLQESLKESKSKKRTDAADGCVPGNPYVGTVQRP